MIVRKEESRLRLTLQTDHALLTGEFAAAWGGPHFAAPAPLAAVRLAAEIHDDGWIEWEREPKVAEESGRPIDFLMLLPDEHLPIYDRGIRQALEYHPYAGLLVSLHGSGLYRQRYGYMPELTYKEVAPAYRPLLDRYLADQEAIQSALIAELQPDEAVLWTHYRWLQAWDLLSLFLCLSDPADRTTRSLGVMPLSPGGPAVPLVAQGAGAGLYTVSPWPFALDRLELHLPVRYLPDRRYGSDEEFQEAFRAAPTERLTVALVPER